MIESHLQKRTKSWEDKSRYASHLRVLIRMLTRELSADGGIYLTKNLPVKPWGYYGKVNAIVLLEENGIDIGEKALKGLTYRDIIELYIERDLDINKLAKIVYENSMTLNPVHRQID